MHISLYKNKIFFSTLLILIISSCQTTINEEKKLSEDIQVISEDIKFEEYLSS